MKSYWSNPQAAKYKFKPQQIQSKNFWVSEQERELLSATDMNPSHLHKQYTSIKEYNPPLSNKICSQLKVYESQTQRQAVWNHRMQAHN